MSKPTADDGLTLNYVTKFKCTTKDCPETCCKGWKIPLDRVSYVKMAEILPSQELDDRTIKSDPPTDSLFATIKLTPSGACPFLDGQDSLCSLQKDYGESTLNSVCRTYPRRTAVIGDRVEQGLYLSCPEAARLCLSSDSATELTRLDSNVVDTDQLLISFNQPDIDRYAYLSYIDVVRDAVLQLLNVRGFPFSARLFITAFFLNRISEFYHQGCETADDAKLEAELNALGVEDTVTELYESFTAIDESPDFPFSVIKNVLIPRIANDSTFSTLIQHIFRTHGIEATRSNDKVELKAIEGDIAQLFSTISNHYISRRNELYQHFSSQLDLILENYSRNFWFSELFVNSPSPFFHMQDLVTRIAIIKFVLVSHPNIDAVIADPTSPAAIEILNRTAVEVLYKFSRGIEHADGFLENMYKEINQQGLGSLAHLILLMKF